MSKTHFGFQTVAEDEKARPRRRRLRLRRDPLRPDERSHVGRAAPRLEGVHHPAVRRARRQPRARRGRRQRRPRARVRASAPARPARSGSPTSTARCSGSAATGCSTAAASMPVAQCDAEKLPFRDGYFDCVSVAFGLRNMTHKDAALAEMTRVLKPGGRLLVLEFSKVWKPLEKPYDWYSFHVLPWLGSKVAGDADELPLSRRVHPHASGPGIITDHDGTRWSRGRPILESDRGRGGAAPRDQILKDSSARSSRHQEVEEA